MSMSYMDWIEKYNLNYQLHIVEPEDNESKIYKQVDLKDEISDLKKLNNTIVDVVATSKINDKYYYKINYKNNLIGWCSPGSNSVRYFKTKRQEIKLLGEGFINNKLNNKLNIDTKKLEQNWFKIFFTDFYAIYNEEVYCGVILKDELIGFIKLEGVSFFIHYKNDFKFIVETVNLYKDSKLTKPSKDEFKHDNQIFESLGGFEGYKGFRVVIDEKRYWVNIDDTNLTIEKSVIESNSDIIIDTLVYQMNEKIHQQNDFYSNKINMLKDKISLLQEKEKNTKETIKKFKEIL